MLRSLAGHHSWPQSAAAAVFGACAVTPALAHAGHVGMHGFESGLAHPLTGLEHVLSMVGVGVWAAQLGGRAIWAIPAAFVTVMLAGAGLALAGVGLPFVEGGIATSVLVLGLIVAMAFRAPIAVGIGLTAAFALFHGHAHGNEMAAGEPVTRTMAGFAISTALLHLTGVRLGMLLAKSRSAIPARVGGGAMAACGCYLLSQVALG